MKWLLLGALILALQQPAKPPESKRATKSNGALHETQGKQPKTSQNPPQKPLPPPVTPEKVAAQPTAGKAAEAQQNQDNFKIQRKLVWFTGLLVLVGAIQAGIFIWQAVVFRRTLQAINRQSAHLADTAEKDLRAYVCVFASEIKFQRPDAPVARVVIKNCGKTPAYQVRHWIHMWIEEYPLKVELPIPPGGFRMATSILPPGGHHIMPMPKEPPINPNYIRELGTRSGTIFIYGEVQYRDIYNRERYTRYRLMYGGATPSRTEPGKDGVPTGLLKPDTEGNEAN